MQKPQSVRNGGRVVVGGFGDRADASLALGEQLEHAQAGLVAQRPKKPDGAGHLGVREARRQPGPVLAGVATRRVSWSFEHLNRSPHDAAWQHALASAGNP